ncbi:GIY-YIG nuclease family protein [Candidatus Venteria ishoeyi]|uniref:T5orf172 domain protein n=1 Tax=Candidatus Venteria ishoeyi TaxID=1899563 RepID=A0A1H6F2P2_9GAMM|nr:GIY-YIG nuclease family protein [Candidatus Venteria ishoeyi]SEH04390.1 T5orf172 domain protein [Candidatus Venteria ishoeyi]
MTDLDALRAELEDFAQPKKKAGLSKQEERIIAGFEEIQRFVEQHGHVPRQGETHDIFERLYAVRLDRLRALEGGLALLEPLDHQGLLSGHKAEQAESVKVPDDDALLAELAEIAGADDITQLSHVRSKAQINTAEEIANREHCQDFEPFQALFEQVERELKAGVRKTLPFGKNARIVKGHCFILGGQMVYVAEVGETIKAPNGETDARLRVIYANGTESNLLRRSLQRALYKDEAGRRISDPDAGPLFSQTWEEDDIESGTIYVLRSLSEDPFIAMHRELIHKIGVTGGKVETRIANATHEATYLLAGVEVVATYKLAGINRSKLEHLFHRIFLSAQLELTIFDRFGHPVQPKEWFLVPLSVIDEVVNHLQNGSITSVRYDPEKAELIQL